MTEYEAQRLLADVLVREYTCVNAYTHDIAAALLAQDDEVAMRFHIVADERGFGPFQMTWWYDDILSILRWLAMFGGEELRFLPDGGIEFRPVPKDEAERLRKQLIHIAKLLNDLNGTAQ